MCSPCAHQQYPECCLGMKSSDPLSDFILMQWALGSSWCGVMPCPVWPEGVSSSWTMKTLMPLTGPHIPES